jgi:site-specific recombinase XerD
VRALPAYTRGAPAQNPAAGHRARRLSGLAGARDKALLLVGFAAAFRRSELVALQVTDLRFAHQGVVIELRQSKTDH